MQWLDTPSRYGLVSRVLHWGMALLFAWQFAGMVVRITVGRSPLTAFMVGSHGGVGVLLFLLVLLRGGWSLLNRGRRPHYERGLPGLAARLGHLALYGLMVTVPALALLRQYGSGRAFAPFGIPLMPGFEGRIESLVAPANAVHGLLAWSLLALVGGHAAMALVHRFLWGDDMLARMAGRRGRVREVAQAERA
ncbi:cytochrome b [Roseomonas sp. E05]|uniref:cytochrome b n=1 Tax=Roseomonas sp. E05 TaxID=3046310 RepID=UPI0024BA347A|nr:cytochrome b [Roseomonas sp. E05]MDJ0389694.1 cytochrome b [Roseomonas sp. E05]